MLLLAFHFRCYTTDPDVRWEFCEELRCGAGGQNKIKKLKHNIIYWPERCRREGRCTAYLTFCVSLIKFGLVFSSGVSLKSSCVLCGSSKSTHPSVLSPMHYIALQSLQSPPPSVLSSMIETVFTRSWLCQLNPVLWPRFGSKGWKVWWLCQYYSVGEDMSGW